MDWNRIEGNWKQLKGKFRQKWAELTDNDLEEIKGNKERLLGKLQERYGEGRDSIRKDLDDFVANL